MKSILVACLACLAATGPLFAQAEPTLITMTVRPAHAPTPALKYALLPEPSELQPGNALLLYYRAFSTEWWGFYHRADVKWHERADETATARLDKLDKNHEFRFVKGWKMLREVDLGARRDHCDWEMLPRVKQDTFMLVLPDIQSMRTFARFLAMRARFEMADGELDQALYTLQTGYALGRHLGEGPTLIHMLVGIAITAVTTQQLEEFIQQPKAPNLYWALARLPRPFVEMRKPLGGEVASSDSVMADLKQLEKEPVPLDLAQKIFDDFVTKCEQLGRGETDRAQLTAITMSLYPKAKAALIAGGRRAAEVEQMPVAQVVLLHSMQEFVRMRDDLFKWSNLPYSEARESVSQADNAFRQAREELSVLPMFFEFAPALTKVRMAQVRTDRKFAVLRCLEAIRLHAAVSDGKPPASLSEIKVVPVPVDPLTGKSFEYSATGNLFTLTAPIPPGGTAGSGWKYEVTVKK